MQCPNRVTLLAGQGTAARREEPRAKAGPDPCLYEFLEEPIQRFAKQRRRGGDADARFFHGRDLVFGAALAALDSLRALQQAAAGAPPP